jgi:acetolactate synthase-1/2/3 large subunit
MLGMHGAAYANYAVEDCDFLIAVASRFDDRVAGNPKQFAPSTRAIAHIDIDVAELGKVKSAHWGHVGDAKAALSDLLSAANGFKKDYSRGERTWSACA